MFAFLSIETPEAEHSVTHALFRGCAVINARKKGRLMQGHQAASFTWKI
jgi:hypothetical protein